MKSSILPPPSALARLHAGRLALAATLALGAGCPADRSSPIERDSGFEPDVPGTEDHDAATVPTDAGIDSGRIVVFAADGRAVSIDATSPFAVRARADFGLEVANVQCLGLRCAAVHPGSKPSVTVFDARDLSTIRAFELADGAEPRDAAFLDEDTLVVSQYGSADLLVFAIGAQTSTPIDLGVLADDDDLPESGRIAICGRRAFVQLGRLDHESGSPSSLDAALAVLDFARPADERIVDADPVADGIQGIALAARAAFDMPVDCAGGRLYVAEPAPLFSGGGAYEVVDLDTLTASEYPIDNGAQVGGFVVVDATHYWRITHTDFGPGASSHLELVGGEVVDTYNTFSGHYVDDLALDRTADLLFFPDPCVVTPSNPACEGGVHVFHARSGHAASATPIDVGFEPIEVTSAR